MGEVLNSSYRVLVKPGHVRILRRGFLGMSVTFLDL